MEGESEGGNIVKYQRWKMVEKSRGYSVLWKIRKRSFDMLCRKLALKYHLVPNLTAHGMKSEEHKKECVFRRAAAACHARLAATSVLKPRHSKRPR